MDIRLINIGFGNIVAANRLVAIVSPESAPIKRIIQEARDRESLIRPRNLRQEDACCHDNRQRPRHTLGGSA